MEEGGRYRHDVSKFPPPLSVSILFHTLCWDVERDDLVDTFKCTSTNIRWCWIKNGYACQYVTKRKSVFSNRPNFVGEGQFG